MVAASPIVSTEQGAASPQNYALRCQADPVWWVRAHLGSEPWYKQKQILESVRDNRETAVASCHAAGKSDNAADAILWFLYSHMPSIVISTAPTSRQVRGILWKYIGTKHASKDADLRGTCLQQELNIERKWYAWGFTAPDYDPDRFQGFHEEHILVVVDEACGVSEKIFDGIDGVLSSQHARLLMIGNPTNPDTPFGKACKREGVSKIYISAFETPNFTQFGITEADIAADTWREKIGHNALPFPKLVTPEWVADKHAKWGPSDPRYIAKVKGRFPESSEDALIPWAWIEAAQNRTLEPIGDERLGVDVGGGTDKTVLLHRDGPVARVLSTHLTPDPMEAAGWVKRALDSRPNCRAYIDKIGIGAGVVGRLIEQGCDAEGVGVGEGSSDSTQYVNLRAEHYWNLRELFRSGDIDIDPRDDELATELCAIKWKPDSRGRVLIEKKEDMKKRLAGRSPDRADALMLAFAVPVKRGADAEDLYGENGIMAQVLAGEAGERRRRNGDAGRPTEIPLRHPPSDEAESEEAMHE